MLCAVWCRTLGHTKNTNCILTVTFTYVMQFYERAQQFMVYKKEQLFNLVFAPVVLMGSTRVARVDTSLVKLCGRRAMMSIISVKLVCTRSKNIENVML